MRLKIWRKRTIRSSTSQILNEAFASTRAMILRPFKRDSNVYSGPLSLTFIDINEIPAKILLLGSQ